jgi:DNA-binding beta-propeller fold protein YncE
MDLLKPSNAKIRSNRRFPFVLSLGVTIIMSVLVASNNVNAQTLESITQNRELLAKTPQIMVGKAPADIQINIQTNKIYVANQRSDSVTVIDSASCTTDDNPTGCPKFYTEKEDGLKQS